MGKMILNGKEYAGSGSEWHEYSTDEKVVGKWIDGKSIYEKTFHITSIVANDNWQNIENVSLKLLIDFDIIPTINGNTSGKETSFNSSRNTPQIQGVASSGVLRYALVSGTGITEFYLTARYTKTTD